MGAKNYFRPQLFWAQKPMLRVCHGSATYGGVHEFGVHGNAWPIGPTKLFKVNFLSRMSYCTIGALVIIIIIKIINNTAYWRHDC